MIEGFNKYDLPVAVEIAGQIFKIRNNCDYRILENAVKIGASVPNWMVKLLKIGLKAIDEVGERLESEVAGGKKEEMEE